MIYETVQDAIAAGESQSVEFKQQLSSDRQLSKALSALANSGGGWFVVGVSDAGEFLGLSDVELERTSDRILSAAAFAIDPPLSVEIERVERYGKTAIAARIPDSPHKPHYVLENGDRAGVFVRQNAASVPAGADMVKALKFRQPNDRVPVQLGKIERVWVECLRDRDRITIKQFCKIANVSQRRAHRMAVELVNAGILNVFQHDRDTYYALNRDSVRHLLTER